MSRWNVIIKLIQRRSVKIKTHAPICQQQMLLLSESFSKHLNSWIWREKVYFQFCWCFCTFSYTARDIHTKRIGHSVNFIRDFAVSLCFNGSKVLFYSAKALFVLLRLERELYCTSYRYFISGLRKECTVHEHSAEDYNLKNISDIQYGQPEGFMARLSFYVVGLEDIDIIFTSQDNENDFTVNDTIYHISEYTLGK